jgi:hypothetical protein
VEFFEFTSGEELVFFEILESISELKLCLIRFLLENIISFGKLNELKRYFHLFD